MRIRLGICLLLSVVATQGIASIVLARAKHQATACATTPSSSLLYGGIRCNVH